MRERLEAFVHGRVQMVMYRDFACRKARGLKLVGEVQNFSDGTVRVIAEGEKKSLEQFVEKLKKGPLLAKVERIDVQWKQTTGTYNSFSLMYG